MSAGCPGAERQAVTNQEGWILGGKGHVVLFIAPLVFMEVEWQASGFRVQEHCQRTQRKTHIAGPSEFPVYLEVLRICLSSSFSGEDHTVKKYTSFS